MNLENLLKQVREGTLTENGEDALSETCNTCFFGIYFEAIQLEVALLYVQSQHKNRLTGFQLIIGFVSIKSQIYFFFVATVRGES